jgi:hypothetical protein
MACTAPGNSQRLGGLLLRALPVLLQQHAAGAAASPHQALCLRLLSSEAASTSGHQQQQHQQHRQAAGVPSGGTQAQQQQPQQDATAGETLEQIRARVFDTTIGDGRRSGRKALMRPLKGKEILDWYFMLRGQEAPLFENDIETE